MLPVLEPHNFSPILAEPLLGPSKIVRDDCSQFLDTSICKSMISKMTFLSSGTVILQVHLLSAIIALLV